MYKKFENVVTPYYTFNFKYINEIINIFLKFYNVSYFELTNLEKSYNKIFRLFIYYIFKNCKLSMDEISFIFNVPIDAVIAISGEFNKEFNKKEKTDFFQSLYSDYLTLQELINDL